MNPGDALPSFTREMTQALINEYAVVSGDRNPLHTDPAFAAKGPFGETIAHGMLLLGYLSEAMTQAFGHAWAASGHLRVRFRAPAKPGDHLRIDGHVRSRAEGEDGGAMLRCALECRNQREDILASGDAVVTVKATGSGTSSS